MPRIEGNLVSVAKRNDWVAEVWSFGAKNPERGPPSPQQRPLTNRAPVSIHHAPQVQSTHLAFLQAPPSNSHTTLLRIRRSALLRRGRFIAPRFKRDGHPTKAAWHFASRAQSETLREEHPSWSAPSSVRNVRPPACLFAQGTVRATLLPHHAAGSWTAAACCRFWAWAACCPEDGTASPSASDGTTSAS